MSECLFAANVCTYTCRSIILNMLKKLKVVGFCINNLSKLITHIMYNATRKNGGNNWDKLLIRCMFSFIFCPLILFSFALRYYSFNFFYLDSVFLNSSLYTSNPCQMIILELCILNLIVFFLIFSKHLCQLSTKESVFFQ